jgi:hypothetical protein
MKLALMLVATSEAPSFGKAIILRTWIEALAPTFRKSVEPTKHVSSSTDSHVFATLCAGSTRITLKHEVSRTSATAPRTSGGIRRGTTSRFMEGKRDVAHYHMRCQLAGQDIDNSRPFGRRLAFVDPVGMDDIATLVGTAADLCWKLAVRSRVEAMIRLYDIAAITVSRLARLRSISYPMYDI